MRSFRSVISGVRLAVAPRASMRALSSSAGAAGGGGGGGGGSFIFGAAVGAGAMWAYNEGYFNGLVGSTAAAPAPAPAPALDVAGVRKEIAALIDADDNRAPLLVRLAWHASGTYDKATKTGGSNGATMRFKPESSDGANAGLDSARALLEPIKAKYPGISYADLWTYAGAVAIEEVGGPKIPFKFGRSDAADASKAPPNGRLPDASKKSDHVRDVFYRMGFNDREIVALVGAHALGRCHTDRSGYEGPWTRAPTTFSNEYFVQLVNTKWTPRKWSGPLQYENPEKDLMMLPADLALIEDAEFAKYVKEYAANQDVFFADFANAFGKLLALGVPGQ